VYSAAAADRRGRPYTNRKTRRKHAHIYVMRVITFNNNRRRRRRRIVITVIVVRRDAHARARRASGERERNEI